MPSFCGIAQLPEVEAPSRNSSKFTAGSEEAIYQSDELDKLAAVTQRMSESTAKASKFQAFIIGIAGGTASGKTTVCQMLMQALGLLDGRIIPAFFLIAFRNLNPCLGFGCHKCRKQATSELP